MKRKQDNSVKIPKANKYKRKYQNGGLVNKYQKPKGFDFSKKFDYSPEAIKERQSRSWQERKDLGMSQLGYNPGEEKDLAMDVGSIFHPGFDFAHAVTKAQEGKYGEAALYGLFAVAPGTAKPLVEGTKKLISKFKPVKNLVKNAKKADILDYNLKQRTLTNYDKPITHPIYERDPNRVKGDLLRKAAKNNERIISGSDYNKVFGQQYHFSPQNNLNIKNLETDPIKLQKYLEKTVGHGEKGIAQSEGFPYKPFFMGASGNIHRGFGKNAYGYTFKPDAKIFNGWDGEITRISVNDFNALKDAGFDAVVSKSGGIPFDEMIIINKNALKDFKGVNKSSIEYENLYDLSPHYINRTFGEISIPKDVNHPDFTKKHWKDIATDEREKFYKKYGSYSIKINQKGEFVSKYQDGGSVNKYQEGGVRKYQMPITSIQDQIGNQTQHIQVENSRQAFLDQRFNHLYGDIYEEELNDWDFKDKYDTSKHAVKMNIDPVYRQMVDERSQRTAKKYGVHKSYYDKFKGNNPNLQWISAASNLNPNASQEDKQRVQDYHNTIIGSALPIPIVEGIALTSKGATLPGLFPSIFKTGINKIKNTNIIKKELTNYNEQGLFNSIKEGGLNKNQINILSKNENLANTVVKNAVKNSDKVTVYRAVNVEKALNNPTAVKAMIKDGVDITNHSDVAKWLSTRVHTGGGGALGASGGLGYRAGGGGSEHFKYGDFAYTLDRPTLLRNKNAVSSQARDYGPWVNKLKIKGTDDLIDFSSGTRGDWVNRLQNYVPYRAQINTAKYTDDFTRGYDFLNTGAVTKINPNSPFVTFNADGSIMNPALRSTTSPDNMFFGPRGQQIFESWGNPVLNPVKVGGKGNIIHKEGGHITSNLKRI